MITFNEPIDPTRAQDTANYIIIGPNGVNEPIASAVYNSATMTVTLDPAEQLDLHQIYQLTIIGTGSTGVADTLGNLLDGARTGQSGSNYVTNLTASQLVLGVTVPGGPKELATLKKELAQIVAAQDKELAKKPTTTKKQATTKAKVAVVAKVDHPATKAPNKAKIKVVAHPKTQQVTAKAHSSPKGKGK